MLSFPPPEAGPKQVRAYVVQLLTTRHDVDLDFAQSTADLWKLGRGVDFRSAAKTNSALSFMNVFGDSVGPFLHRTAREEFIADYRGSFTGTATSWALNATLVLGLLLVIRTISQPSSEKKTKAFFEACLIAGMSAFIVGVIDFCHIITGVALAWGFWGFCGIMVGGSSLIILSIRAADREVQEAIKKKSEK
jgi:hypothetical protein